MLTLDDVVVGDQLPMLVHEVDASTIVIGALASRDYRPMHHDRSFAQDRNGVRDIFMNTPTQAGFFARYVSDWSGGARMGEMRFRMLEPLFPGERMELTGAVLQVQTAKEGLAWAVLELTMSVDQLVKTTCTATIALATAPDDDPWLRRGTDWPPSLEEE